MIYLSIAFLVFVLALVFYFLIWRRPRVGRSLNRRLLLIRLPKEEKKETDLKTEIGASEQLFGVLAGLKEYSVLEAAVHHVGEEIYFYADVAVEAADFVKRQIQGIWPAAEISEAEDYTIFNPQGSVAGGYLTLKQNFLLPLRTYDEAGLDTFAPILSNLSQLGEVGEGAAIQILFRPAFKSTRNSILKAITRLRKGEAAETVLNVKLDFWKNFQKAVTAQKEEKDALAQRPPIVEEDLVKALQKKAAKPLLEVNYRIIASAGSPLRTTEIFESLSSSFSRAGAAFRNDLAVVSPRGIKNFDFNFIFRNFDNHQSMILNTEELATLFHLPGPTTLVPRINWLKAKEAAPPPNLPGVEAGAGGVLIGESRFRGDTRPVYLLPEDRERHLYLIGQTGTGKSTLILNLAIQDIKNGEGIAVIDPHGDLISGILGSVPAERLKDVIIFDPTDIQRPIGLNMLEYDPKRPEEKTFIVNEMQSIFNKLFTAETMGPMFEQYMRNALLLLMEDFANEPATLVEVPRVFTDAEWRKKKLARVTNPNVLDFWEKEAVKAGGEASLANMTPYITSKFNNFIANDYLRPIIGQPRSAFNFRQALDNGKIILVNLSKGRLGDINAHLLGMIITGKILMAALSRVDIPEAEKRRRFYLYIDEFQNFTTDSIAVILSEARKYKLALTMAHQFIAQLSEKIRDSVFGNVGSIVAFRVGIQDAEFLSKQFAPAFDVNDLINIENRNAHLRLLIKGQPSPPFNIRVLPPERPDAALTEKVREFSRLTYTKNREEVETGIYKRLRE